MYSAFGSRAVLHTLSRAAEKKATLRGCSGLIEGERWGDKVGAAQVSSNHFTFNAPTGSRAAPQNLPSVLHPFAPSI